jgi:hypothetical protein
MNGNWFHLELCNKNDNAWCRLRLRAHLGIIDTCRQFDSAAIVFEGPTLRMRCCCLQSTSLFPHFLNQLHVWKYFAS